MTDIRVDLARERRKATLWIVATWLFFPAMFAAGIYVSTLQWGGDKWDRAVALGTCGGF